MEEQIVTSQDSFWVERHSKGYTYGAKVYAKAGELPVDMEVRLEALMMWLKSKYGSEAPF